jgi:hypothetical protein
VRFTAVELGRGWRRVAGAWIAIERKSRMKIKIMKMSKIKSTIKSRIQSAT